MASQNDLQNIKSIVSGLNANRIAALGYTNEAFDADDADGVMVFNINAGNNIPKETCTDYNTTVQQKGVQTQGASIPRRAWNHYIGRASYNLNKLVQTAGKMAAYIASSFAHNCFEYDSTAKYRQDDCCYVIYEENGVWVRAVYRRIGGNPDEIVNISPLAQGQTEWEIVPESAVVQVAAAVMDYIDARITEEAQIRLNKANALSQAIEELLGMIADLRNQTRDHAVMLEFILQVLSGYFDFITTEGGGFFVTETGCYLVARK